VKVLFGENGLDGVTYRFSHGVSLFRPAGAQFFTRNKKTKKEKEERKRKFKVV
jgi:hypothetical protein